MYDVHEWDDNHKSYTYGAYRKKPQLVKQTDKTKRVEGVRSGLMKKEGKIKLGVPNIQFNMGEFLWLQNETTEANRIDLNFHLTNLFLII